MPSSAQFSGQTRQDNKTVASVLVGGKVKRDFGFQYRALSESLGRVCSDSAAFACRPS